MTSCSYAFAAIKLARGATRGGGGRAGLGFVLLSYSGLHLLRDLRFHCLFVSFVAVAVLCPITKSAAAFSASSTALHASAGTVENLAQALGRTRQVTARAQAQEEREGGDEAAASAIDARSFSADTSVASAAFLSFSSPLFFLLLRRGACVTAAAAAATASSESSKLIDEDTGGAGVSRRCRCRCRSRGARRCRVGGVGVRGRRLGGGGVAGLVAAGSM